MATMHAEQHNANCAVLCETPELFGKSTNTQCSSSALISYSDHRDAPLHWNDSALAVEWSMRSDAAVMTPNTNWMPEFPVAEPGEIQTCVDGCWGPQEFSLWPQLYNPSVIHHSCIPTADGVLLRQYAVPTILYEPIDSSQWRLHEICGVPDLGVLESDYLALLRGALLAVVYQFIAHNKSTSHTMAWGHHLTLTICQGLDCLAMLPAWQLHTIALAAHLQ